jgi:hypothetical protein
MCCGREGWLLHHKQDAFLGANSLVLTGQHPLSRGLTNPTAESPGPRDQPQVADKPSHVGVGIVSPVWVFLIESHGLTPCHVPTRSGSGEFGKEGD